MPCSSALSLRTSAEYSVSAEISSPQGRVSIPVQAAPFFPVTRIGRVIDAAITKLSGCKHRNITSLSPYEDQCLDCDAWRYRSSGTGLWYSSPLPIVKVMRRRNRLAARKLASAQPSPVVPHFTRNAASIQEVR